MIGGVSVHTGTIPSKTVREAIFQLTASAVKALYGGGHRSRGDISVQDVSSRVGAVVARETEIIREQLKRNGIAIHQGRARFVDPHTVEVEGDGEGATVKAEKILVVCGTRPAHSPDILFDNHRIVDTDRLADLGGLRKKVRRCVRQGIPGEQFDETGQQRPAYQQVPLGRLGIPVSCAGEICGFGTGYRVVPASVAAHCDTIDGIAGSGDSKVGTL